MRTITFIDSAYPKAHQLEAFIWSGRLDEAGTLWFDLHLKSQYYYRSEGEEYIEEEEEEEGEDTVYDSWNSWQSKIVWDNYHQCTLSSSYWSDEEGICIGDEEHPFDFRELQDRVFTLDTLPLPADWTEEDAAFGIYLLGHDWCANHNLQFTALANGLYDIQWKGKIALAYGGFYEYLHDFEARITDATFDGFYFPTAWSLEEATDRFKKVLRSFEQYTFVDLNPKSHKREYKLALLTEVNRI
ncbi:hypothetical protein ACPDHL_09465 [Myroides sp. C15-4]|uniref:hypothetical protein n=1 Tax=Myroides sp. C15-4 TaxID=3400532 RepID=UPI003D2F6E54